ncbi:hypothetical protein E6O75_ATG08363 [Venturia nashicola]|uniref:Uncharacterized protein n=1 Tax=Venturia nashicola TaxID=86259 RepID=A0A4Z1P4H1_9PEZI|nr:hypothetical protein E6O75_ATG08363 [Venturia nashicola]
MYIIQSSVPVPVQFEALFIHSSIHHPAQSMTREEEGVVREKAIIQRECRPGIPNITNKYLSQAFRQYVQLQPR